MRPLPASLVRPALRRQWNKTGSVRFNSSNTNPSVQNAQQKAQEALTSAQKTAGKLMESSKKLIGPAGDAAARLSNLAGPVGRGASRLLGSYREPVLYNLAVARELVKQVYRAEGLSPPTSFETIQSAYKTLWSRASSPSYWRGIISSGEILSVGILGLEAYGIFKIGEIIGRRSLVGYNIHD